MIKNKILMTNIKKIKSDNVKLSLIRAIEKLGIREWSQKKEDEIIIIMICELLKDYKISDFTWERLCILQNIDIEVFLEENIDIFEDSHLGIVRSFIRRYANGLDSPGYQYNSKLVSQIYLECIEFDQSLIIREFEEFLIINNRNNLNDRKVLGQDSVLIKSVLNNFPINTKKESIISSGYKRKDICGYTKVNVNCNTENSFLKKLYGLYWKFEVEEGSMAKSLRMFFYYCSIECTTFSKFSYKSFDMEFLRYSYKKLFKIQQELEKKFDRNIYLRDHIVKFYRFLNIQMKTLNIDNCLSKIELEALDSYSIYKILRYDYNLCYYNPNEKPPIYDKFCIMPNKYTLLSSHNKNNVVFFVDLNKVDIIFRDDFKEFLWNDDSNMKERFDRHVIVINFLNEAAKYNKKIINLGKINKSGEIIKNEFIYKFRCSLELKYENTNTLKSTLKSIRKYLKYYKDKYELSSEAFHILNLKGLEVSNGGKVITDKDLKLIYNEFIEIEKSIEGGRLYSIIFEVFIYSNLRIGEIINLKKDCIIEEDNKTYIKFISKTGNKELIKVVIGEEVKRLLREAINITNSYRKEGIVDNYIFVKPYHRKGGNNVRLNFYARFKNVIKKIENNLENANYHPYNMRHTYMNKVCEEAQKSNLSFSEIEGITNDSIKTIRKYYQQRDRVELMAEIMAGVTISDVSINGTILKNEILKSKSVKGNLGKCKEEECTFDIAECLICKHFITFTNRKITFINSIKKCEEEILETKNEFVKKEKIVEKKLLARYLAEICKIEEKENT